MKATILPSSAFCKRRRRVASRPFRHGRNFPCRIPGDRTQQKKRWDRYRIALGIPTRLPPGMCVALPDGELRLAVSGVRLVAEHRVQGCRRRMSNGEGGCIVLPKSPPRGAVRETAMPSGPRCRVTISPGATGKSRAPVGDDANITPPPARASLCESDLGIRVHKFQQLSRSRLSTAGAGSQPMLERTHSQRLVRK